jgi:elongation factor P
MAATNQISPGMIITLDGKVFRVESSVKVTVARGNPFVKTKLKDLMTEEVLEKNFKVNQSVDEVTLVEHRLEFLYHEGKDYLFINIDELEEVLVSVDVIAEKMNYLKEGTRITALFYGKAIFSVELPQYLELMVVKTETPEANVASNNVEKIAILETGARVDVPMFVESGDVVKVDTHLGEYIQRV